MAITAVPCRAVISIADLTVKTPFVLSFNVRKARGQVGTFDASLKVSHDEVNGSISGGNAVVQAGTRGRLNKIFTGMVTAAKISPCFDDPHYAILSVQGVEYIGQLKGKKYTRRCRATKGLFCTIQSVVRKGLKSGKFTYEREVGSLSMDDGEMDEALPVTKSKSVSDYGQIETEKAGSKANLGDVSFSILYQDPKSGASEGD